MIGNAARGKTAGARASSRAPPLAPACRKIGEPRLCESRIADLRRFHQPFVERQRRGLHIRMLSQAASPRGAGGASFGGSKTAAGSDSTALESGRIILKPQRPLVQSRHGRRERQAEARPRPRARIFEPHETFLHPLTIRRGNSPDHDRRHSCRSGRLAASPRCQPSPARGRHPGAHRISRRYRPDWREPADQLSATIEHQARFGADLQSKTAIFRRWLIAVRQHPGHVGGVEIDGFSGPAPASARAIIGSALKSGWGIGFLNDLFSASAIFLPAIWRIATPVRRGCAAASAGS